VLPYLLHREDRRDHPYRRGPRRVWHPSRGRRRRPSLIKAEFQHQVGLNETPAQEMNRLTAIIARRAPEIADAFAASGDAEKVHLRYNYGLAIGNGIL